MRKHETIFWLKLRKRYTPDPAAYNEPVAYKVMYAWDEKSP